MIHSVLKTCGVVLKRNGKNVLTNVSFTVAPGEVVCLLGQNGAGKSTLLRACAGLMPPSEGKIFLQSKDLKNFAVDERASLVSWLPQSLPRVENFLVETYVSLASERIRFDEGRKNLSDQERDCVLNSLALFDAVAFRHRDIASLSGGEWVRVQLARVWAQQAKLLCLDEPNGELDLKHLTLLAERIKQHASETGAAFLISSHDLGFAFAVSDRILLMGEGRILKDMRARDAFGSSILEEVYGVPIDWRGTPGPFFYRRNLRRQTL